MECYIGAQQIVNSACLFLMREPLPVTCKQTVHFRYGGCLLKPVHVQDICSEVPVSLIKCVISSQGI